MVRAALEQAFAGEGRLLMLVGEPGIGKTRLAQKLAAEASQRDSLVLWGRWTVRLKNRSRRRCSWRGAGAVCHATASATR